MVVNVILFAKVKGVSVVAMRTDFTANSCTATLDIFSVDLIAAIGNSSTITTAITVVDAIHALTEEQMGKRMFSIKADKTGVMGEIKERPKLVAEDIQSFFGDARLHLVNICHLIGLGR